MNRKRILVAACVLIGWVATPAGAYYINYEGDVLPEDAGWTLVGDSPDPAKYSHSVNDGIYTIDATADGLADIDYTNIVAPHSETVFYEWRSMNSNDDGGSYFRLDILGYPHWSSVSVSWVDSFAVAYFYQESGILTTWARVDLLPQKYNSFRVESSEATYSLYINDAFIMESDLQDLNGAECMVTYGFVKNKYNEPTSTYLDYLRVGIAPEPAAFIYMLMIFALRKKY